MKINSYRSVDQNDIKEVLKSGKLDLEKLEAIIGNDSELRVNYEDENDWKTFLHRFNEIRSLMQKEGGK